MKPIIFKILIQWPKLWKNIYSVSTIKLLKHYTELKEWKNWFMWLEIRKEGLQFLCKDFVKQKLKNTSNIWWEKWHKSNPIWRESDTRIPLGHEMAESVYLKCQYWTIGNGSRLQYWNILRLQLDSPAHEWCRRSKVGTEILAILVLAYGLISFDLWDSPKKWLIRFNKKLKMTLIL